MPSPTEGNHSKPKRPASAGWLIPVLLLVLLAAAATYLAISRFHVLGGGPPLVVTTARVTVDHQSGRCPSSSYRFTGKVLTNGAGGPLTYQWVQPDGTTTDTASASTATGQKEWTVTLQFTFQGRAQATGDAILKVISPAEVKSSAAHVEYRCP